MCQPKKIKYHGPLHGTTHSNKLPTDLQETVMLGHQGNKRFFDGMVATSATAADKRRYDNIRCIVHIPSFDGCFEDLGKVENDDDQESIDSQATPYDITSHEDENDDDYSILSQTSTLEDSDDDAGDDDSLTSIISSKSYTETSSSKESSSSSVDAFGSKRRVVFVRQQNEIYTIPHRHEYTQDEIKSSWYRHQDMTLMKMERSEEEAIARQNPEKLIEVPEVESFPEELSASSLSLSLLSPLHAQHVSGAFHRGSCKPTDKQSAARIHAVIDAVLDEQETQWLDEEEDAEFDSDRVLAQASLERSRICERDALRRAHLDALEAIPIYLEASATSMDTTTISPKSSSSHSAIISHHLSANNKMKKLRARFGWHQSSSSSSSGTVVVSECRWNAVSSRKRVMADGKVQDIITTSSSSSSRPPQESNSRSDELMTMPRRMGSIHGLELKEKEEEVKHEESLLLMLPAERGLAMPKRMASFDSTHADDEGDDILSVASSSSEFSLNSELEFGGDHHHHHYGDFLEDLAPPSVSPPITPTNKNKNNKVAKNKTRTCKFFSKSGDDCDGIYQKMKRKLKGSKKKMNKNINKKETRDKSTY